MCLSVNNVYSTKASHSLESSVALQPLFTQGTSLGDVYQGLAQGQLQQGVQEWLADQTSEPSHWAFPEIRHANGFEAYQVNQQVPA